MTCHAAPSNGSWRTLEGISSSMRSSRGSSITRFIDRHTFGTPFEQLPAIHRAAQHRIQVRVAADYSDSKPEASSYLGDLGYHPLEGISSHEKRNTTDLTDGRLTDAELARTIAEANETAILFASLWEDKDNVFGTEVEYLIDEKGDFYFQIDDHSEFLATLHSTNSQMNVAIGYESIDDWILEQQQVLDESTPEDSKDEHSTDEEGEQEETWAIITADGTEYILEEVVEEEPEPSEEELIGNWSGLDTLASVHPLEFASALATAALADDKEEFEKPSQSLRIVGEVHRLNEGEEEYVQRLAENRFNRGIEGGEEEESDDEGGEESTEEADESEQEEDVLVKTTSLSQFGESSRAVGEEEEGHEHEAGTSFYKLDIKSIHVLSYFRAESTVDNSEFCVAKPDILARAASEIIERLNARGKVLEDALKSLCLHRKGLEVEEVALLHLDSLGMDLRVHCGREVRNLRISFRQRATSVQHAEQLLNELLFPQVPLRRRRKRRSWPQGKSS